MDNEFADYINSTLKRTKSSLDDIGSFVNRIANLLELKEIKERLELGIVYAAKAEKAKNKEKLLVCLSHVRELTLRLQALELILWGTALITDSDIAELGMLIKELEKND